MKYLRLYEEIEIKKFWLVSNNVGEFKLSLDILGVDKGSGFYNYDRMPFEGDQVYFAIVNKGDYSRYEWDLSNRDGYIWFINNNYEYMGELEIPENMLNQYKYNL